MMTRDDDSRASGCARVDSLSLDGKHHGSDRQLVAARDTHQRSSRVIKGAEVEACGGTTLRGALDRAEKVDTDGECGVA